MDCLWDKILAELNKLGWIPTVDLFASAANARCDRFCSRGHEAGAECTDAFSVLDWSESWCPLCSQWHGEVAYAYPPTGLVRPTVSKAMQDGARIVLVVPLAVTSPQWHKLMDASVLDCQEGFLRVRNVCKEVRLLGSEGPRELAVFVCDFGGPSRRTDLERGRGCPGAVGRRARALCGSTRDAADRARLHEELRRLVTEDGPGGASHASPGAEG